MFLYFFIFYMEKNNNIFIISNESKLVTIFKIRNGNNGRLIVDNIMIYRYFRMR